MFKVIIKHGNGEDWEEYVRTYRPNGNPSLRWEDSTGDRPNRQSEQGLELLYQGEKNGPYGQDLED